MAKAIEHWLLDLLEDGLILIDAEWRIVHVNAAAERFLALDRGELVGGVIGREVPEPSPPRMAIYRAVMETRRPEILRAVRLESAATAGHVFDGEVVPAPNGGIAIVFRDATERIRMQESEALREISRDILSRVQPEKVLARVSRHARLLLGADYAAVATVEPETGRTVWRAVTGNRTDAWRASTFPPGQGTAGRVIKVNHPLVITGFPDNPDFPPEEFLVHQAEGMRSAVGVPLTAPTGAALGALIAAWRSPVRIGAREVDLARALAQSAGVAMENARLFAETEAAREQAEAASRAKSRFLAVVSHELRTPLNAILGYLELLELGLSGPLSPAQRSYLDRVHTSSTHLLDLVNGVLDMARLESGEVPPLRREHVDAGDLVEAALLLVEPAADERQVELRRRERCEPGVALVGDEATARQVLVNLLSNAIKFTDPGGRVCVYCGTTDVPEPDAVLEGTGPWVRITVEDTGIGIAGHKIETIFDPFVQADEGYTRSRGGTGVGLTIARQLARRMGGDVTVRSRPGVGSTFQVWLPAAESAAPPRERVWAAPPAALDGLLPVGEALAHGAEDLVIEMARRMRDDPEMRTARQVEDGALRNHQATLIADIGASIAGVGLGGSELMHVRDGTAIQRVVAERHGAQRARIGFSEAELQHEYALLRELIESVAREALLPDTDDGTLAVVLGLVDRACEISLRAYRVAVEDGAG